MEFTLPSTLENGEYLLRGEHIGIHENRKSPPCLRMVVLSLTCEQQMLVDLRYDPNNPDADLVPVYCHDSKLTNRLVLLVL